MSTALAGCSSTSTTTPVAVAPTSTSAPIAPADTRPAENSNGNLPKAIGEDGAVVFDGTEKNAITFKVTNIEVNPDCTGDGSFKVPSKNGEFVAMTVEITTDPEYLKIMSAGEPLRFFWQDWEG
ncbi:hypothetical protein [Subtercola boreus]|uniref:hypothetical protein n=1 Tax=Subtercola boreus TaxID=120213 RepID=UPI00114D7B99|nr:hypothetical protein [Subtercola boreus]